MALYRGNDTKVLSEAITDADGIPLVTGTVKATILSVIGGTVYIAEVSMEHDAGGVWFYIYQASEIDTIPTLIRSALIRITVGDPVDATFERVEDVLPRRASGS